nr:retrovirus-related Pol polyprotein from transposon TNT 1-94 [Tanacetum cinerariifolium]
MDISWYVDEYAEVLRRVRGGNTLSILSPFEEEQTGLKYCFLKKVGNLTMVDTMPNIDTINTSPTINISRSVLDDDLFLPQLLDSRGGSYITNVPTFGPSNTRDIKIVASRLKFNAFEALEGEKVNGTYTRLKCLLNDLKNNEVIISQSEVNATFVNSLPRKWLSMNQTQRANNSIKMIVWLLSMGSITMRKDSDSDVKEDNKINNEFMADLNAKCHERVLLENEKIFYKRSGRLGSARKPMDKSKETCFACEKAALRGKGRRKENNSLKKVLFTKADISTSESALMITSDSEDDSGNQEPLPSLPRLTGAELSSASKSLVLLFGLTTNMAELTLNTTSKKGTIFNEKDKAVLIAPKRRDVYVIDMSSYNTDNNACFYFKASPSVNWL